MHEHASVLNRAAYSVGTCMIQYAKIESSPVWGISGLAELIIYVLNNMQFFAESVPNR